MRPDKSGLVGV